MTVTVLLPHGESSLPIRGLMTITVAFSLVQLSVTVPGIVESVSGVIVNVPIGCCNTITLSTQVNDPAGPTSVRVNTVFSVTVLILAPVVGTLPIPLSIFVEVAFCDVHWRVTTPPPNGSVSGTIVNVPVGGTNANTLST